MTNPDLVPLDGCRDVRVSVPVDGPSLSQLGLPAPGADGLIRLHGAREVRTGGAAAEAQGDRPASSPHDRGAE